MKIYFYNVEHGSCCHIITPANNHILVDIGSKTDVSIVEYIKFKYFQGISGNIDALIITHPHEDHIYDLPNLYRVLTPRILVRPNSAFRITPTLDTLQHKIIAECANKMNDTYNGTVLPEQNPLLAQVNGGVQLDIIWPELEWTTKQDLNTFSCIIILSFCGYKFVLTGDNPADILHIMMQRDYSNIRSKVKDATVLLAPHHGRENGFCQEFFDCVNPYLTVVSDGSIIHSTQAETEMLYRGRGAELYGEKRYVLTTRNDGTISFDVGPQGCFVSYGEEQY